MRLPNRHVLWARIEKIAADVDTLKYIAQNDVDLSPADVQEWLDDASVLCFNLQAEVQTMTTHQSRSMREARVSG